MTNILQGENNLTRRGRGRPKGSQNKVSKAAKDAIAEAAEKLGGVERMVNWAKEAPENERAFWATIYPKLIAVQVEGTGTDGAHLLQAVGPLQWQPPT